MPKVVNCPHCGSALIPHEGVNEGFAHCNSCGCCFVEATGEQRPGHSVCNPVAAQMMAESAVSSDEVKALVDEISVLKTTLEEKDKDIETVTQEGVTAAAKIIADNDEAIKALKAEHEAAIKALQAQHAEQLKVAAAAKPTGDNK